MQDHGLHLGQPYFGDLKARAAGRDNGSRRVISPLTTLLANGWTDGQIIAVLRMAGIHGMTPAGLKQDPMAGMEHINVRRLFDGSLALIQSTLTVGAALQIIDALARYQPVSGLMSGFDITYAQLQELDEFLDLILHLGRLLTTIISHEQIRLAVGNIALGTAHCIGQGLGVPPVATADIFIKSAAALGNFLIVKFSEDLRYEPQEYKIGLWVLELANSFFVIKYKDEPCILKLIDEGLLPDVAGSTACKINLEEEVECF
jgi:hypothetical protein